MAMSWILLVVGLALVVKGGDWFVQAAIGLAERLRLPRVVVGGTLMALATTSPEVVVSVMSGMRDASSLALGNAAGSVACNVGLIAAVPALMVSVATHRGHLAVPGTALGLFSLLAVAFAANGRVSRGEGVALLVLGLTYFALDLLRNLRAPGDPEIEREAAAIEEAHRPAAGLGRMVGLFAIAAVMVIGGSRLLVSSAVLIAQAAGISPMTIGLTIVAIGTSLPELVTAIVSARRGVSDLAVGNILGANVANVTLVLGAAAGLSPIDLSRTDVLVNSAALLLFTGLILWLGLGLQRIPRRWAYGMLGLYAAYLACVTLVSSL